MGHYQHLIKDANALIEHVPRGSMSSDYHGSKRYKKRSSKHSSKKSSKKKERQRGLEEGEVGFIAGVLPHEKKTHDVQSQVRGRGMSPYYYHSDHHSLLLEISNEAYKLFLLEIIESLIPYGIHS